MRVNGTGSAVEMSPRSPTLKGERVNTLAHFIWILVVAGFLALFVYHWTGGGENQRREIKHFQPLDVEPEYLLKEKRILPPMRAEGSASNSYYRPLGESL